MGVRKRERELLLQLEEKRNHYQDADASYKAGLRSMFVERDKGNEIEARRLLREIFLPAQDHYNQCQRDFFIGFAKLLCVKAERMEDFARRISELVFEANCDGFSRGEMPTTDNHIP
jgi:hypothetical protein